MANSKCGVECVNERVRLPTHHGPYYLLAAVATIMQPVDTIRIVG